MGEIIILGIATLCLLFIAVPLITSSENNPTGFFGVKHTENETGFNSYEEAVEAALKYCLTKLI